jgi:hypothetical protein
VVGAKPLKAAERKTSKGTLPLAMVINNAQPETSILALPLQQRDGANKQHKLWLVRERTSPM